MKRTLIMFLSIGLAIPAIAQESEATPISQGTMLLIILILVLIVALLVLAIGMYVISIVRIILLEDKKQKAEAEGKIYDPSTEKSWWQKFTSSATDSVPVEKEETIMLDHEYDGIRELDNHLPPWWKWLFYGTIVWAIGYLLVYHVFDALPLMEEEYAIVMEDAKSAREAMMAKEGNNIDENNVESSDDPDVLAKGKTIYDRDCAVCHAPEGQGLIGPNFTDNYWLHGGGIKNVFHTIKYGVPEKGMIPWQSKLSPSDIRDVASYVLTFEGTTPKNPPAPKGPEGEEYKPGAE